MVMAQAFNGAGDTYTPTMISIGTNWVLQIPLAWFLAFKLNLGPTGVFMSIAISASMRAPALGSAHPKTNLGIRAFTIAPAHIGQGSRVT